MIKRIQLTLMIIVLAIGSQAQKELPIGTTAPDFNAADQKGEMVQLSKLAEKGPIILLFYRGEWCQHCNRQFSNLHDSLSYINKFNAQIIAVGPEKPKHIEQTQQQSGINIPVIYDANHEIMDDFQVTFKMGIVMNWIWKIGGIDINEASGNKDRTLPVPATYIMDKDLKIIGSHYDEDHTTRMTVQEMIEVLGKNED